MLESRVLFGASVLACVTVHLAWSHREHKVHNIVLYPDKHSWCKTTPIKQVVAYPGCGAVHVDNNVCVGACFSYSIPRTSPSAPGEMIKPYCDSCQPSSVTWRHVTLTCEGEDDMEERVQMINNCSCSTCDTGEEGGGGGGGGGHSPHPAASPASPPPLVDVPKLKDLMLLEEDEEEPLDLDSSALKELLRQVEGVDHRVNQAALEELVRKVEESENILLDIVKLRHVLTRYARERVEKEQTGHVKVHRHHLHSHHHSSHHGAGGSDGTHPLLADMSGGSGGETATTPQAGDGGGGGGGGGGFVGSGGIGNEEKGDPTLDVASHHLKPALHGAELGYHENVVLPENEKHTNKEPDGF